MKTDAQLIEEAVYDADAFGELCRRHADAVQRYREKPVAAPPRAATGAR
jgi:hypothetical protein